MIITLAEMLSFAEPVSAAKEVEEMCAALPDCDFSLIEQSKLARELVRVRLEQTSLVESLEKKLLTKEQYFDKVNELVASLLSNCAAIVGPERAKAYFGSTGNRPFLDHRKTFFNQP